MSKLEAVPVTGIEVLPVKGGAAVFLVTALKTMFIQVDPAVGEALQGAMEGRGALEGGIDHLVLLDARLAAERLGQHRGSVMIPVARKIAEVDARPSDALVLAVKAKRPVFVAKAVLDVCDDMTEMLARLRKQA